MSRPTMSMVSSTDPTNESCDAEFTVGDKIWTFRLTNRQALSISSMVNAAYREGRASGQRRMAREIESFIESLSYE